MNDIQFPFWVRDNSLMNSLIPIVQNSDTFKHYQTDINKTNWDGQWLVEYITEKSGVIEFWIFHYYNDKAYDFIRCFINEDKSETITIVAFGVNGKDRVRTEHHLHGINSPN